MNFTFSVIARRGLYVHFNDRFFKSEIQILFAELDVEISEEEIVKAKKMLNSGKSGGPNRLLNSWAAISFGADLHLLLC